jgi:hypothetical protein
MLVQAKGGIKGVTHACDARQRRLLHTHSTGSGIVVEAGAAKLFAETGTAAQPVHTCAAGWSNGFGGAGMESTQAHPQLQSSSGACPCAHTHARLQQVAQLLAGCSGQLRIQLGALLVAEPHASQGRLKVGACRCDSLRYARCRSGCERLVNQAHQATATASDYQEQKHHQTM